MTLLRLSLLVTKGRRNKNKSELQLLIVLFLQMNFPVLLINCILCIRRGEYTSHGNCGFSSVPVAFELSTSASR